MRIEGTDLDVFPLCLGGNVFTWTADEAASLAVLDAYADRGGNFVDTADVYGEWMPGQSGGDSEAVIGRWHTKRGNRDDLVIATKVGMKHDRLGVSAENGSAASSSSTSASALRGTTPTASPGSKRLPDPSSDSST